VVEDRIVPARLIRSTGRRSGVSLELEGRGVDLVEESVVLAVAIGGIRASVPRGASVLAVENTKT
jgi:hypothetical protein